MDKISRVISFDSRIEWIEAMCDLTCGSVEEDTETVDDGDDLVCDTEGDDY